MQHLSFRFLTFFSLVATLAASGCAFIGDRADEYKTAQEGGELEVPSPLVSDRLRERFYIPNLDSQSVPEGEFILPSPPDATASLTDDPYTVVSVDGDSWLEVAMPPSKAWPLVDNFWLDNGLIASSKEVDNGYFATEELDERVSHQALIDALEETSHEPVVIEGVSFQARLTQGVRRNTSEIQVRAFLPNIDNSAKAAWHPKPATPKLERAMLELIGETITSEGADARYSLNAVNIGDESRVRMLEDEAGYPYLQIRLSYKRSWREVQDALRESPAFVAGSEREEGTIFVSYLDEEDIDNWYTLDSQLEELKKQRNLELKFYAEEPTLIIIRARTLTEEVEPESARQLIELIFEYIS